MRDFEAYRLGMLPALTEGDKRKLIHMYGSAKTALQIPSGEAHCVLQKHAEGFLRDREDHDLDQRIRESFEKLKQRGIRYMPMEDRMYPDRLRETMGHPYALYMCGELPDLTHAVAVVGARRISQYGRRMAAELGSVLGGYEITVVSGMARGVDSTAQEACLKADGHTVAVLGCGVDVCYPPEQRELYEKIKENGCILSEHSPGTEPRPTFFPARNRIISGLSECVVVVEAADKSGSLITADMALEQGRDVYAVPGRVGDPNSSGCNRLIAQGAGIVLSAEYFLMDSGIGERAVDRNEYTVHSSEAIPGKTEEEYSNIGGTEPGAAGMQEAQQSVRTRLLEALDLYPRSVTELSSELALPAELVQRELTMLEILGRVRQSSVGFYNII